VPACLSSPILAVDAHAGPLPEADPTDPVPADLLAVLAAVPDPRASRGVRQGMVTLLGIAVCAVLAGARTFTAIAEWAHDLPVGVRVRLGLGRAAPSESTIRRMLQAVDGDALDRATCRWILARARASDPNRAAPAAPGPVGPGVAGGLVIAIDGKSARGARGPDGRAVHLLAAFDQVSGVVPVRAWWCGRQDQRDHRVRPTARPYRPHRRDRHR